MTETAWRRYDAGGIVGTVVINGKPHHTAAHPASERNPGRYPAAAWCRDCKSDRCEACNIALAEVGAGPAGRAYTDPKDGSRA